MRVPYGAKVFSYRDGFTVHKLGAMHHREDGPAIILPGEWVEWWLNDKKYSLEEFVEKTPYLQTPGERLAFYLKWK